MTDELTRRDFIKSACFAVAGIAGIGSVSWAARPAQDQDEPKDEPDQEQPEDPAEDDLDDLFGGDEEETRACPQCGALMYKQGNTWTCETCGYTYVE